MKCMIVLVAVLAVSSAQFRNTRQGKSGAFRAQAVPRPARASSSDQAANIVRQDFDLQPDGSYAYGYETDNGISAQEQGQPRPVGQETPIVAQGFYSYTSADGVPVAISYVADENGFQPQGELLPVGPPVPPQIQRALEWLARNAPQQRKK